MKKKTGFTLIELLAVIVILAIIALIAVPVILNIIDKANKSAFKDTAYGILNAAELYFAEQQLDLNGMSEDIAIELPDTTNTLELKGEIPEGKVEITKNGEVSLMVKNERYCVTKGYNETEVTLSEDIEHCYMPHTLAALSVEEVACATVKTEDACEPGSLFQIKINNTDTKYFYVIKDEGEKVNLIMAENLGSNVPWISKGNYDDDTSYGIYGNNNKGPITVINYLDELTNEEWNNIPKREYTYSGLAEDGETRKYEDIIRTMRARLLTYVETTSSEIGCSTDNYSCPRWIYTNLRNGNNVSLPYGYWTSTASLEFSHGAWNMDAAGRLYASDVVGTNNGIRPVIELSK